MSEPRTEFDLAGYSLPKGKNYYKALVAAGFLLTCILIVLEITEPDESDRHGLWSLFALVGVTISGVFGSI